MRATRFARGRVREMAFVIETEIEVRRGRRRQDGCVLRQVRRELAEDSQFVWCGRFDPSCCVIYSEFKKADYSLRRDSTRLANWASAARAVLDAFYTL